MACCERGHTKVDSDGMRRTIPCRKNEVASAMLKMLQTRREHLFGSADIVNYRMLTAILPSFMQGLPCKIPAPRSVNDFVAENRFSGARDEENCGSGATPLMTPASTSCALRTVVQVRHP